MVSSLIIIGAGFLWLAKTTLESQAFRLNKNIPHHRFTMS